jgi:hypothetical protein
MFSLADTDLTLAVESFAQAFRCFLCLSRFYLSSKIPRTWLTLSYQSLFSKDRQRKGWLRVYCDTQQTAKWNGDPCEAGVLKGVLTASIRLVKLQQMATKFHSTKRQIAANPLICVQENPEGDVEVDKCKDWNIKLEEK